MVVPALVVRPGEGRSVSLGGMGVVFKVSGADTGGAFAVVEHPIEPGRLVLPHVHLREELAAKYGLTYSSDWVAELTSRYNLKLLGQ